MQQKMKTQFLCSLKSNVNDVSMMNSRIYSIILNIIIQPESSMEERLNGIG